MAHPAQQQAFAAPVFRLYRCAPVPVLKRLSGRSVTSERCPVLAIPKRYQRFLVTPERIDALTFAERYRVVPDSAAHSGKWRRQHAPHTAKILKAFSDPRVREVWYCASEQSGKTMTLTNCLAWSVEQLAGDIFYLMPGEEAAKNVVEQLLKPLFEKSDHLKGYLSSRKDDTANTRIRLRNGKIIRPSWATSALSMATWAAQCVFCDEVDKYVFQSGSSAVDKNSSAQKKETDPITLIRKRTRTFRGREKFFFCSTPAGRYVRKGTISCHQVWEWHQRCPHCEKLIRPEGEHLDYEGKTIDQVDRDGITLACHKCGGDIDEQQRIQAIRAGSWVAIKGESIARPERVGFIHRAWDCLDVTLKEIGVAWLKNLSGNLTDKIAWQNGIEADDYQHEQKDREEDQILRLVDENLPRGTVPENTSKILMLVDTQKRGFFYQVWACGYGPDVSTTMIDHGYVERQAHLIDLANKEWLQADSTPHKVLRAYIDSGGGTDPHNRKHSRTSAVYEFCRKNKKFLPIKGNSRQDEIWSTKKIDFYPTRSGRKIPMKNGPILYKLQVNHWKDELAEKLLISPGAPGCITLHAGTGTDYAKQMCAEYADERGQWHCPRGKANHHWDGGVYLRAAITIEQLANKRPPVNRPTPQPKPKRRNFVTGW